MGDQMRAACQGTFKNVDFTIMAQGIAQAAKLCDVVGYELTIRPAGGGSASEVIELAVDHQERVDLDIAVFQTVRSFEKYRDYIPPRNLWINLFPTTLTSSSAMALICGVISRAKHRIVVEITENEVVTDYKQLYRSVCMLKQAGAAVVVDDFGAGAATIKTLMELPVDGIKLDLAVFQQAAQDPRYVPLVSGLVDTAAKLRIPVVAEGIETLQHLRVAQQLGVNYVQGFYVHKPEQFAYVSGGGIVRPGITQGREKHQVREVTDNERKAIGAPASKSDCRLRA